MRSQPAALARGAARAHLGEVRAHLPAPKRRTVPGPNCPRGSLDHSLSSVGLASRTPCGPGFTDADGWERGTRAFLRDLRGH